MTKCTSRAGLRPGAFALALTVAGLLVGSVGVEAQDSVSSPSMYLCAPVFGRGA